MKSTAKKTKLVSVPQEPTTDAQRATHTMVDTIMFDRETAESWMSPPFQRDIRVNDKVRALVLSVRHDGGVIPGVITLGVLGDKTYLVDGQHRRHAFMASELLIGYADVRTHFFDTMGAMGREYVRINQSFVRLRPDDVLKGLEAEIAALGYIRKNCPFVGYDMIRRGGKSPVLSMSMALRCWYSAARETPAQGGPTAIELAESLTIESAQEFACFLGLAMRAWGRDDEYQRLWSSLNLTLSMWLYNQTVVRESTAKRSTQLSRDLFVKALSSLSTSSDYTMHLSGRRLSERERSPTYRRMIALMITRLTAETGKKPKMPQPAWASH